MTERETGEFIAVQKSMEKKLTELEEAVTEMRDQQTVLFQKLSVGKGFVTGMIVASGGAGATVASIITKMAG